MFLQAMGCLEQRDQAARHGVTQPLVYVAGKKIGNRFQKVAPRYKLPVAGLELGEFVRHLHDRHLPLQKEACGDRNGGKDG